MRIFSVALLLIFVFGAKAQLPYKYRVFLTDKQENSGLLTKPNQLLSTRALARRAHHEVSVDTTDLPVSPSYVKALAEAGFPFVCASRWFNSVVVAAADGKAAATLASLPFVREARLVWKDNGVQPSFFVKEDTLRRSKRVQENPALIQLTALHGDQLHRAGYRGEGMQIAVLDAGFLNADKIEAFNGKILGTHDFVDPSGDIYATHPHGTNVLSVMAFTPSPIFSGTAPNASYWLLRTEDSSSEYPVEEDYWIAAAEYADSLGVDIINSSLGYNVFDDATMNYRIEQVDGKSAYITRGASMAAAKGILVVNSAGNDGARLWRMLTFPADSRDILTVGAVDPAFNAAAFSGHGFLSKGYVKPNVMGIGSPAFVINDQGALESGSGTSFSTPAVAGLAACLWQSLPQLRSSEVIRLLEQSATQAQTPDSLMGYGVPDVYHAYTQVTPLRVTTASAYRLIPVDTLAGIWRLEGIDDPQFAGVLNVCNPAGRRVAHFSFTGNNSTFNLGTLEKGLYIISVQAPAVRFSQRIHLSGQ